MEMAVASLKGRKDGVCLNIRPAKKSRGSQWRSNVSAGPFELVAEHTKEGNVRQESELERYFSTADRDVCIRRHSNWLSTIHAQECRILAARGRNLDHGRIANNN